MLGEFVENRHLRDFCLPVAVCGLPACSVHVNLRALASMMASIAKSEITAERARREWTVASPGEGV